MRYCVPFFSTEHGATAHEEALGTARTGLTVGLEEGGGEVVELGEVGVAVGRGPRSKTVSCYV